ncbi:MAG TPA: pitrilysin family protein [Bryobacteraceae bacterium]|nr:pitrilysin family protein [Bryobacteraceae bacterium]
MLRRLCTIACLAVLSSTSAPGADPKPKFSVPVSYYKLPNGLRVVLSEDHTAPTVVVAVYYNIGFRNEPRDRTGFAHLFEHMMFQGSNNLGKMEFIRLVQENGGQLNGSTRFDYTNYFEVVPAHKLETMLWAEADRMRGLAITQENLKNQQGVVTNEVKVNVLNSPYGGFPWLDMPQVANTNWYNAHNFYGDLQDLEAATLNDVSKFFKTFYSPNNAVVTVVGDFDPAAARKMIEKYFGGIQRSQLPKPPDLTEPRQTEEKRTTKEYPNAKQPALGFAYHVPERNTPEWYAMGLIDQMLAQGNDSLLTLELARKRGYTENVNAGINYGLGNQFNYNGPMLYIVDLIHDASVNPDQILKATDSVIDSLAAKPVDKALLDRALVKWRSQFYSELRQFGGFGTADLLSSFALFEDNPSRINTLEDEFRKVTPELIQKTAKEYLRRSNRTVLVAVPPKAQTNANPTGTEKAQ